MKDKNNRLIKIGMNVQGKLTKNVGYYSDDDAELNILIEKNTIIKGKVIKSGNKLCVSTHSIMMPYVSMLKKSTREILEEQ